MKKYINIYYFMNIKQLFMLSTLCLTMGAVEAPAQGFLGKLKSKGAALVKEIAPKPVKEAVETVEEAHSAVKNVVESVDDAGSTVNRGKKRMENGRSSRPAVRNSGGSRRVGQRAQAHRGGNFHPAKKMLTIKLRDGVGRQVWNGRKAFQSPMPPEQCPKQPAWFESLPFLHEMDNASMLREHKILEKWLEDDKPACEPVLVRREACLSEVNDRISCLDNAVDYLLADHADDDYYDAARPLESEVFKRTMQSDITPLYPYLKESTVKYLKSINPATHTVTVRGYEGNSADEERYQLGELWFSVNASRSEAKVLYVDMDQSVGKDYEVPATIHYGGCVFRVTEIEANDFSDMRIRSVKLPEGLKVINEQAFSRTPITSIIIPSTVTEIKSYAFHNTPIKSVMIPNSVKKIDVGAFSMCGSLTEVTMPASLDRMGNTMFLGCKMLSKVTLPQNLTELPVGTFQDCKSLTHVDVPQSVSKYDQNCFANSGMTSVPVPAQLTSIGSRAFEGCTRITSISLPSRVEIGMFAFQNCKGLKKVAIGQQYKANPNELFVMFNGCSFVSPRMMKVPACVTFNP